jgi:putative chitinase
MSFDFEFNADQVRELLKGNSETDEWFEAMEEILPFYEINTVNRVAGFIAQCAHESNNFRVLQENLNYSSKALDAIFGKYFVRAGRNAKEYHRQPEKIANVIYASRMDNGDTASGDGWRFRGRGVIQLTGRHNYTKFGSSLSITAEQAIKYVKTKKGALESACWFWDTNKINRYADKQDITGMTKRINGGTIGLADRKKHYKHALEVLGGHWSPPKVVHSTVRKGSKGETVKAVQKALGAKADGDFGPGTEAAVIAWQRSRGLVPDGIVGPSTLRAMGIT